MTLLDYLIIAIVAALFILAFIAYRKKPHCSCGSSCCGNCSNCSHKCSSSSAKKSET